MTKDGVLVYSAIYGEYDMARKPIVPGRYRLFTDGRAPGGWEEHHEGIPRDPQRRARYWKTVGMPSDFPYTLWLDGNARILEDPERIIKEWLIDTGADLAIFKHPIRDCAYEEAKICKSKRKDYPEIINAQMDRYRERGYPTHFGLAESPIIARRRCSAVDWFNLRWWEEIERGSCRDQLSFDYVRWTMGDKIKINFIDGGTRWRKRKHDWFEFIQHNYIKRR